MNTLAARRGNKKKQPQLLLGGDEPRSDRPAVSPKRYRRNPYAACVVRVGKGTEVFLYVNAAIPAGKHPSDGVCPKCQAPDPNGGRTAKVSYSHMMHGTLSHCRECEGDRIALLGIALERQGINLGWGCCDHTREYERESHQQYRAR